MIILDLWCYDCWVTITHIPDVCSTLPRSKDNRQSLSTSWEYSLTSSLSAKTKCKMCSVSHSTWLSLSVCNWCFWKIVDSQAYLDMCLSCVFLSIPMGAKSLFIYIYRCKGLVNNGYTQYLHLHMRTYYLYTHIYIYNHPGILGTRNWSIQ